jgi:hypothetical protein
MLGRPARSAELTTKPSAGANRLLVVCPQVSSLTCSVVANYQDDVAIRGTNGAQG